MVNINDHELHDKMASLMTRFSELAEVIQRRSAGAPHDERGRYADDIEYLFKVVVKGNGKDALLTRVTFLEKETPDLRERIKQLEQAEADRKQAKADALKARQAEEEQQRRDKEKEERDRRFQARLQYTITAVGAIIAIICAIISRI